VEVNIRDVRIGVVGILLHPNVVRSMLDSLAIAPSAWKVGVNSADRGANAILLRVIFSVWLTVANTGSLPLGYALPRSRLSLSSHWRGY
jgi:hypothetical protein